METRKRKPLSDLTNTYNLIPTSTLRKLVASASNSSSILKPPISILKPNNPNSNQKLKVCSDSSNRLDSISETSIGSSNVSALRDSRTVRFGTPKRANREITSPVRNSRNKDTAYIRREVIEKSNKSRAAAAVIVSPTPLEKRKHKGKTIDAPSKTPNNENEIRNCSLEKTKDGKKVILNPSNSSIAETKVIRKEIPSPSSFLVERTKEKEKGPSVLSSLHEKARDKGKAVLNPSEIVEITKHQGSSAALAANYPRTRKSEKRKNDAGASSCPRMMRNKNIQNDLDEAEDIKFSKSWTDPHLKCRKKRGSRNGELPLDFIEKQRAYYKEVDDFELPEEEISQDELD